MQYTLKINIRIICEEMVPQYFLNEVPDLTIVYKDILNQYS